MGRPTAAIKIHINYAGHNIFYCNGNKGITLNFTHLKNMHVTTESDKILHNI
jgi:hypothetical protein